VPAPIDWMKRSRFARGKRSLRQSPEITRQARRRTRAGVGVPSDQKRGSPGWPGWA
jgi:hypothetical protein